MKIREIIELLNPNVISCFSQDLDIGVVCLDSRKVVPGCAFIAIDGTQTDGHNFIDKAIEKGAVLIIANLDYKTQHSDVCILKVRDTKDIVGLLAQAVNNYPADKLKIIGITGTNGKTTTASLVYQILTASGIKTAFLGTTKKIIGDKIFKSKLTTSDAIELANDMALMVKENVEYLVMEVSSHALHQKRTKGVKFDVAAFTNLSHDHLDYHSTIDEYADAKKILFNSLQSDATAVINTDDDYGHYMVEKCAANIIEVNLGTENRFIASNTINGLVLEIDGLEIYSPLIGVFNAYNIIEVFFICKALNIATNKIIIALKTAKGAPGRMELVNLNDFDKADYPNVIVDYAHTPDALLNVLSTLKSLKGLTQKLIVVFGAGGDRDTSKRPTMAQISEQYADEIIVTSDNPRTEDPALIIDDIKKGFTQTADYHTLVSREEAIYKAVEIANNNDIILVAGKGHETYQEIDGVRHDFDDREIAKSALLNKLSGGTHAV